MKKNILKFLYVTAVLIAVIGCYEPNEACLDFYASNYTISADTECEDCCEFPDLIMQFSHRLDSSIFAVGDTFLDDFDNAFVLREFGFLLSNIELVDDLGESHFIEDSILITSREISSYYKNDFDNIKTGTSSYSIGAVKIAAPIVKVNYTLGVEIDSIDFADLESDFILNQLDSTYLSEEKFLPWNLLIERDTVSGLIDTIQADVENNRFMEFSKELNNVVGSDIRVPINIEYRKLLEGIDMNSSTEEEIKVLLNANISKTFN